MAAYAALVSVMQILHQIENHPSPPISLNQQQVQSLTAIVTFLQEFLQGYNSSVTDSDKADPVEMRIADAAYAAEDVIESSIVDQILPAGSENYRGYTMGFFSCFRSLNESKNDEEKMNSFDLYEALQKVIEDMESIKKEAAEIIAEKAVVGDQLQIQVSATAGSSKSYGLNNAVVGFEGVQLELMDKLTAGRFDRQVIPIVGMGGIGKTTLATSIYEHPLVKDRFDICVWATISQQYRTKDILSHLLCQVDKEGSERLSKTREDQLGLALYQYLSHRRFLIVLDDMWSIEAWEKIHHFFPDNNNSSRIMVTTRLSNLASHLDNSYGLEMRFLDEVSSWNMFSRIVFKGESCPLELEKIGKKIVENCRGLPLSIVVMGGLLEKLERTKECWDSIRRNSNSVVNTENVEHCLKILTMSYDHLPVYLKSCFLFMGVFGENTAIRVSTIVKLWVSEGFLKPTSGKSLEAIAEEYLRGLIDRNLIAVDRLGSTGSVKYCKIHDLLRDLCIRKAENERFYHVVGRRTPRGTYSPRGIVNLRSISKKKVLLDALESIPRARFYISDRARVRLLPNLSLLRILKAYDRYKHPRHVYFLNDIFRLVNLRYLAVKVHRHSQFPSSVNLLWNLQTLIVYHPRKIDAPVEIWKMPQLRHVQFYKRGLILPDPPRDNIVVMENLQTLTGVRDFKCDKEVVRRIPNIKKLGILYYKDKGTRSHDDNYCLHNIECLQRLESFSCECDRSGDYMQKLTFPQSLKSLTLHMKGHFEMEGMLEKIGSLPLLQKLKLKNGYLRTGIWETVEGQFSSLKFLSLKWCFNLENWLTEGSPFPRLEHLHLIGLTDLNEIPSEIGEVPTLQSIRLEYCSESAITSAKRLVEEQEESQGEQLPFKVVVKLWKENEALQSLASTNFEVTIDKLIPLSVYLCFRLLVCCSCST